MAICRGFIRDSTEPQLIYVVGENHVFSTIFLLGGISTALEYSLDSDPAILHVTQECDLHSVPSKHRNMAPHLRIEMRLDDSHILDTEAMAGRQVVPIFS
jgi:hypothetical protein